MKRWIGFVAAFLLLMGAGVALADADHVSKGRLLSVGPSGVTMFDRDRRLTLEITGTTTILDDAGRPLPLASLGTGDYVREECMRMPDGRSVARRITVLRPAWRQLESPEL